MKKIRMQDVAESLNISKATVSRALNNKEDISPQMKEMVIEKCEEMGYSINYNAKALATQKNNIIGIITNDIFTEEGEFFYREIYMHIVKMLDIRGYATTLKVVNAEEKEKLTMPLFIQNAMIDGIIVIGELSKEFIRELGKNKIPMVLVDFDLGTNEYDSISTSNILSTSIVVDMLIKQKYENIVFVGNSSLTNSINERYWGYRMEMEKNNLNTAQLIDKNHTEDEPMFHEKDIYQYDVFVCNNDYTAYRLIEFIKALGFSVPQQKRVIGFDNTLYSEISVPKISTVEVKRTVFAREAVAMLLKRIKNRDSEVVNVTLTGNYVQKES